MKLGTKRIVIGAAGVILLTASLYQATSQNETSLSSKSAAANESAAVTQTNAAKSKTADDEKDVATADAAHRALVPARAKAFGATSEQRETLATYAKIRRKVFLTEADKRARSKLLRDNDFIQSLLPLVTASTAGNDEGAEVQNAALDLLYDALAGDGKSAATAVLAEAVKDDQVENKNLPVKDRESLAGVKAEALYEWTARDEAAGGTVAALLPGDVSRQLWENVRTRQERNLASSAAESAKPAGN